MRPGEGQRSLPMITFDPAWLAERGVTAAQLLPIPGMPMLVVQHRIEGALYEFLAKLPTIGPGPGPKTPQDILEAAKSQIEAGIAERHRLLAEKPA
jgi:hypothetical protein